MAEAGPSGGSIAEELDMAAQLTVIIATSYTGAVPCTNLIEAVVSSFSFVPGLSECQAGFRYGADEQAWALVETLRLRRRLPQRCRRTLVAFVDVPEALDTVWRDGLLHELWMRGVRGRAWVSCAALLRDTRSCARVRGTTTQQWTETSGVRQGAILSPIEFLVFIDDLAAEIHASCPGVALGPEPTAPRVRLLLYADDVVIFADSERNIHNAMQVMERWAAKWRLSFGLGEDKSAIMLVFGGPREGPSPFSLAGRVLPFVP